MPNLGFKLNLCRLRLRMCYQLCMCRHTTQKLHRHTDNECKIMHTDGTVSKTSLSADSLPFPNCDVYLLLNGARPCWQMPTKNCFIFNFYPVIREKRGKWHHIQKFFGLRDAKKRRKQTFPSFLSSEERLMKEKGLFYWDVLLFVPASQDC